MQYICPRETNYHASKTKKDMIETYKTLILRDGIILVSQHTGPKNWILNGEFVTGTANIYRGTVPGKIAQAGESVEVIVPICNILYGER